MSTSPERTSSACYRDGNIMVSLPDGSEVCFAVADNPRLAVGNVEQLSLIEISPFGLHWPALDKDLSLRGLQAGNFGQRAPGPSSSAHRPFAART